MISFKNIGLGGTFDRLHIGHLLFLDIAAHYGQVIHVGLINASYLEKKPKKYGEIIQTYEKREKAVKRCLLDREKKIYFFKIDMPDKDQLLASKSELEALVVSQETCLGAIVINQLRIKENKTKLTIIIVPPVVRENGDVESSTKLREEEIDF